ncbi:MAG: class I SAM-dependent methyltransferase family protein, partial [Thermoplasmata archaeon]|nr:class I SAM-dependent methyltransferase family protein [Thermoplasmata archaeon]
MRILRGKGTIHYHETCPERLMPSRPIERMKEAARDAEKEAEIIEIRKIKSYSPGVWHVVVDVTIS